MTPDTPADSASLHNSQPSDSPLSPLREPTSAHSGNEQREVVSETMREEEMKMLRASMQQEEDRIRETREELHNKDGIDVKAFDAKFSKLENLLKASQASR